MLDIRKAKEYLIKREEKIKNARLKRFKTAKNDFYKIVDMIIQKYYPKKIIQWGSLLNFKRFDENSDIDIAVQGILDPEQYFDLLGEAMEMTRFKLDIVQLEKIEPEFAELILLKGKVVYEN